MVFVELKVSLPNNDQGTRLANTTVSSCYVRIVQRNPQTSQVSAFSSNAKDLKVRTCTLVPALTKPNNTNTCLKV